MSVECCPECGWDQGYHGFGCSRKVTDPSPTPAEPQPFTVEEIAEVIASMDDLARCPEEWGAGSFRATASYFRRLAATLSSLQQDAERWRWLIEWANDPQTNIEDVGPLLAGAIWKGRVFGDGVEAVDVARSSEDQW